MPTSRRPKPRNRRLAFFNYSLGTALLVGTLFLSGTTRSSIQVKSPTTELNQLGDLSASMPWASAIDWAPVGLPLAWESQMIDADMAQQVWADVISGEWLPGIQALQAATPDSDSQVLIDNELWQWISTLNHVQVDRDLRWYRGVFGDTKFGLLVKQSNDTPTNRELVHAILLLETHDDSLNLSVRAIHAYPFSDSDRPPLLPNQWSDQRLAMGTSQDDQSHLEWYRLSRRDLDEVFLDLQELGWQRTSQTALVDVEVFTKSQSSLQLRMIPNPKATFETVLVRQLTP